MMQRLLPYGLQQYLDTYIAKPIIELCSFFKQICSRTLMEDDMVKAESQLVDIMCNLEQIYPPALFDIMIHLVIHLPEEALKGMPIPYRWMYPFERFMKKLKNYIHQRYIDKDPSISDELFALACGPSSTPISVNSCVVNGVRVIVYNRDERRTTKNNGICSPGEKDGEMYFGQLEEILEANIFYLEDMARRPLHWKVVQDVNHKNTTTLIDDDNDFIDDEEDVPHDLAYSDDEVLANDDDDDVAATVVYSSEEEDLS
ncbi:putative reverse transcriptase domain-containing protein [Tanacetum coccineum]